MLCGSGELEDVVHGHHYVKNIFYNPGSHSAIFTFLMAF